MKSFLKFAGIVLVVAVAAFGVSLWVSHRNSATPTELPRFEAPQEHNISKTGPQKISADEASFPFLVAATGEIRYYHARSGDIRTVKLPSGAPTTVATIKPFATGITWSPDGNELIADYAIGRTYVNLKTGVSKKLDAKIVNPVFATATSDVAYVYFNDATGEGNISIADSQFKNFKNILKTRLKQWGLQWTTERRLSLVATSPITNLETLFLLDTQTKELTSLIDQQSDLDTRWSPDGKKLAYSRRTRQAKAKLFLMDADSTTEQPLDLAVAASRCAWSSDSAALFCANTDGSLVKLSAANPSQAPEKLLSADEMNFVDAQEMIYVNALQALVFKNLKDGRLYFVTIAQ